jgi:hypothetical protein
MNNRSDIRSKKFKKTGRNVTVSRCSLINSTIEKLMQYDSLLPNEKKNMINPYVDTIYTKVGNSKTVEVPKYIQNEAIVKWNLMKRKSVSSSINQNNIITNTNTNTNTIGGKNNTNPAHTRLNKRDRYVGNDPYIMNPDISGVIDDYPSKQPVNFPSDYSTDYSIRDHNRLQRNNMNNRKNVGQSIIADQKYGRGGTYGDLPRDYEIFSDRSASMIQDNMNWNRTADDVPNMDKNSFALMEKQGLSRGDLFMPDDTNDVEYPYDTNSLKYQQIVENRRKKNVDMYDTYDQSSELADYTDAQDAGDIQASADHNVSNMEFMSTLNNNLNNFNVAGNEIYDQPRCTTCGEDDGYALNGQNYDNDYQGTYDNPDYDYDSEYDNDSDYAYDGQVANNNRNNNINGNKNNNIKNIKNIKNNGNNNMADADTDNSYDSYENNSGSMYILWLVLLVAVVGYILYKRKHKTSGNLTQ